MFEELYTPIPDCNAYLERIGLAGAAPSPTLSWLDTLVHAQLTHIPFDDMDVWARGICPSLAVAELFDKMILRRRGGYCYELNSLFLALLKTLGFDCYAVQVCVMDGRDFLPPSSHCAIVCRIGGEKYFCDLGYGGAVPDGALSFCGMERFGFRIGEKDDFRSLEMLRKGAWDTIMLFRDVPALPVELLPANFYISQKADSPFRSTLHVNLRLENGSVYIKDRLFKRSEAGESIQLQLESREQLLRLLEEHFAIPAPEVPVKEGFFE